MSKREIALKISMALMNSKLSMCELARQLGVDMKTVYRWRNGEHMPNAYYLAKICSLLKLDVNYILGLK